MADERQLRLLDVLRLVHARAFLAEPLVAEAGWRRGGSRKPPRGRSALSRWGRKVLKMGWILAILIVTVAIGAGVGDAVSSPYLYGLFVASILIVPLWIACSVVGAIIDAIFGRRK